jgi:diadenosine tetraphosphatase ApaH/serine/threonine PP2A family protein phosphatase
MTNFKRTIVVGDVHGCVDELKELIAKLQINPREDHLIFVGDLVNKGPFSFEVLQYVQTLNAVVVKGNHEARFIHYLDRPGIEIPTFAELAAKLGDKLQDWKRWMEQLPLYYETDDCLVVHAGIVPGRPISQTSEEFLTTIRTWDGIGKNLNNPADPAWYDLYTGEKLIVFGHWSVRGLVQRPNVIGLDTGCVYGKQLSAVILPTREIVQVNAKRVYKPIGE